MQHGSYGLTPLCVQVCGQYCVSVEDRLREFAQVFPLLSLPLISPLPPSIPCIHGSYSLGSAIVCGSYTFHYYSRATYHPFMGLAHTLQANESPCQAVVSSSLPPPPLKLPLCASPSLPSGSCVHKVSVPTHTQSLAMTTIPVLHVYNC